MVRPFQPTRRLLQLFLLGFATNHIRQGHPAKKQYEQRDTNPRKFQGLAFCCVWALPQCITWVLYFFCHRSAFGEPVRNICCSTAYFSEFPRCR
jgi:hypothetical protein